ncbi:hypothetical protein QAD02_013506 [Eretmocerus hayati]|uniref:Uncharacterized protein n=1 Tax=Eretmocerus hayati TaxID=131215 RepID=A0ACC2P598_9HYME|nr:hypothetical protein QAD02_013506 [Eretmocerus hayati]
MPKFCCRTDRSRFCYVCGALTFKQNIRNMTDSFISLYHAYFKRDVRDLNETYVPNCVCKSCYSTLQLWSDGKRKSMPFGTPMIWSKPTDHSKDCYFCLCPTEGFNRKNRKKIEYPDSTSSRRPQPHSPDVPVPPAPWNRQEVSCEDRDSGNDTMDVFDIPPDFSEDTSANLRLFDQPNLNDTVRDLGLTKEKSQLFGSRLQEMGLLSPGAIHKRKSAKRSFQAMVDDS